MAVVVEGEGRTVVPGLQGPGYVLPDEGKGQSGYH